MNVSVKRLIKIAIMLAAIFSIWFILQKNSSSLELIKSITLEGIAALVVLNIILLFIYSYTQHRILLLRFQINQTFNEWFGLAFIAAFYNQVLPIKGGSIIRSAYLKTKYRLTFKGFASSFVVQAMYTVMVCLVFLAVALMFVEEGTLVSDYKYAIVALVILMTVFMVAAEKKIVALIARIKNIEANIDNIASSFASISLIILVYLGFRGLTFYVVFQSIGYDVLFLYCLIVAAIVMVSNFVSLLPGNLGVKELLIGLVMNVLGNDLSVSVMAALLDRMATLVVVMVGALVYKYILLKEARI